MSYNLFLDDIRMPEQAANYMHPNIAVLYRTLEWMIVRNHKEFVDMITHHGLPEMVSFDHDLADVHYDPSTWTQGFEYTEETGYDSAKWLAQYCMDKKLEFPDYIVHSQNGIGAENIMKYLENFKKHYEYDK